MKRFPKSVREAMMASGASATCVPVKLEAEDWETALFFRVEGPECGEDRRALKEATGPITVGIETDLMENGHAAVVMMRLEAYTLPGNPLAAEILLVPGHNPSHFDALKLLARQPRLCWFFGDTDFRILHSQTQPWEQSAHAGIDDLLRDAVKHDTLIRCTGRYDARAALSEVVSHYELRTGTARR